MSIPKLKLTLKQIDRWFYEHFAAASEGEPWVDAPSFATVRRRMLPEIAHLEQLAAAMRDPFAPGAADVLASFNEQEELSQLEEWGATLQSMGEALRWGLAGADPAELERFRAMYAAAKASTAARIPRENASEMIERRTAADVEQLLSDAVKVAEGTGRYPGRPLTHAERWRLVLELQERLGICERGNHEKPSARVVQGG